MTLTFILKIANLVFVATRAFVFYKYMFLCRLRSIATHRDHFVLRPSVCSSVGPSIRPSVRLSVRPSVTLSKAMFHRQHMHSSECCQYFLLLICTDICNPPPNFPVVITFLLNQIKHCQECTLNALPFNSWDLMITCTCQLFTVTEAKSCRCQGY